MDPRVKKRKRGRPKKPTIFRADAVQFRNLVRRACKARGVRLSDLGDKWVANAMMSTRELKIDVADRLLDAVFRSKGRGKEKGEEIPYGDWAWAYKLVHPSDKPRRPMLVMIKGEAGLAALEIVSRVQKVARPRLRPEVSNALFRDLRRFFDGYEWIYRLPKVSRKMDYLSPTGGKRLLKAAQKPENRVLGALRGIAPEPYWEGLFGGFVTSANHNDWLKQFPEPDGPLCWLSERPSNGGQ